MLNVHTPTKKLPGGGEKATIQPLQQRMGIPPVVRVSMSSSGRQGCQRGGTRLQECAPSVTDEHRRKRPYTFVCCSVGHRYFSGSGAESTQQQPSLCWLHVCVCVCVNIILYDMICMHACDFFVVCFTTYIHSSFNVDFVFLPAAIVYYAKTLDKTGGQCVEAIIRQRKATCIHGIPGQTA